MTIALILEIWLGLDSESFKLDHDMNNNHFGSLSIRLQYLTVSLLLKIVKIGQKEGIKNISAGWVKIQCLYMHLDNFLFFLIPVLKFDRQSLSSRVTAILT